MDGGEKSTELERPVSKPSAVYPYVEGQFGIPLNDLKTPFEGEKRTGSGRYVLCEIRDEGKKSWIRVVDNKDHYIMHALVKGDTANAEIHTRKKDGKRHPDFFAKHFLAFALNYFKNQGYLIKKFRAIWSPVESDEWESDNYAEYWRLRKEGVSPIEAAKQTWSGRTFEELGFTEVEEPVDEGRAVTVVFKKPDAALTNKS